MSEYSKGYKAGYREAVKELQRKVMSNVGDSEFLVDIGRKDGKEVIEEIFGTTYEPEILKKFADNPLLLIENIKEYEESKTTQESNIHCHYLNRTCPYDIPCLTCDVCKAFEAAMEKAKENDNA